jgi:hypothetical protein
MRNSECQESGTANKFATETLALLTLAYEEYATKEPSVFEWHRRFMEGREDVQGVPRSGQPKAQRTDADVDRIQTLVQSDRRSGMGPRAEELNTGICSEEETHL